MANCDQLLLPQVLLMVSILFLRHVALLLLFLFLPFPVQLQLFRANNFRLRCRRAAGQPQTCQRCRPGFVRVSKCCQQTLSAQSACTNEEHFSSFSKTHKDWSRKYIYDYLLFSIVMFAERERDFFKIASSSCDAKTRCKLAGVCFVHYPLEARIKRKRGRHIYCLNK